MRIGVRTNTGEERRLILAEQLGAQGGSIWASALPGFNERGVPDRDGLAAMRERFARHNLVLTGIGLGGDILKTQLLGLPERDRDIASVCETIRRIGETFADAPLADRPVIIIDQRPTYWAHGGWTGSSRVAGRGGVRFYDFDAARRRSGRRPRRLCHARSGVAAHGLSVRTDRARGRGSGHLAGDAPR